MSYPTHLALNHGLLNLPTFLPDATLGVVRAVDTLDVAEAGLSALMMNVFHLMQKPGSSTIHALGGLHRMAGWDGPIVTDSGGFQAYSLIRQNARLGSISDRGITVKAEGRQRKFQLTPEKSIQLQLSYGADIVTCLDDCTHVDAPQAEQEIAVERTIAWAVRCRQEFDRLLNERNVDKTPPRLFAVIQGGASPDLRRRCAEALLELGFDGYGYGGWPLDGENQLVTEMLTYTRELVPAEFPLHALGIGHPHHVLTGVRLGYQIFDCALPTRDARRGRLYTLLQPLAPAFAFHEPWFAYLYLQDRKHIKANHPVSEGCTCHTCRHFSLGYLHHLFKSNEIGFQRLATIHNLHFMAQLMRLLSTGTAVGSSNV